MSCQRKTRDVYVLRANYGMGWEDEIEEDSWREMRERLKEYRENAPQYQYRCTRRRERIEAAA